MRIRQQRRSLETSQVQRSERAETIGSRAQVGNVVFAPDDWCSLRGVFVMTLSTLPASKPHLYAMFLSLLYSTLLFQGVWFILRNMAFFQIKLLFSPSYRPCMSRSIFCTVDPIINWPAAVKTSFIPMLSDISAAQCHGLALSPGSALKYSQPITPPKVGNC